jgi:hypothetical protein
MMDESPVFRLIFLLRATRCLITLHYLLLMQNLLISPLLDFLSQNATSILFIAQSFALSGLSAGEKIL